MSLIDILNAGRDNWTDYSDIHAIGHITGGGLSNLLDVIHSDDNETPLPHQNSLGWLVLCR